MQSVPDGTEVVATASEAARLNLPPFLILDAVEEFMTAHGLGTGPLSWDRIGDGQSNVTFRIQRGGDVFVLRRGPRPPLPKSTHDMVREARIQQLIGLHGIPVPKVLAVCADASVLGVPFYIMSFIEGTIITDRIPAYLASAGQRKATSEAVIDSLIQVHQVDVTAGDLASLAKPAGYLRRQVERFSNLWDTNTTRSLPEVARIGGWLERNLPDSQATALVHGDFRIGNLMFALQAPAQVTGILDWEMATIGDPLADLGYLTATYAEAGSPRTPLELTSVTREPGYLGRDNLVARYQERTGLDLTALPWYQTLALWKAAIFCEAIYSRWMNGERPHDTSFAPILKDGVPRILERSREFAGCS
ncbi:phosphotransferase family protein [Specibacter sp. RAF43]|uniref:phosphotransferase family protein n=1 Tax=Specibacter sp. RAF43 TaxID=3233057 RepID=UPI003F9AEEA2